MVYVDSDRLPHVTRYIDVQFQFISRIAPIIYDLNDFIGQPLCHFSAILYEFVSYAMLINYIAAHSLVVTSIVSTADELHATVGWFSLHFFCTARIHN